MFGRHKQSNGAPGDPHMWNGWTQSMIERVNGVGRFDFQLLTLQIIHGFYVRSGTLTQ